MHIPELVRRKIFKFNVSSKPKLNFFIFSIGRPKHVRIMAGALEGDIFVGPKAEDHRGLLSIRYPMEHGIVTDWNDMERIWTHIFSKVSITYHFHHTLKSSINKISITGRAVYIFRRTSCSFDRSTSKSSKESREIC
jgi:actin-related protein